MPRATVSGQRPSRTHAPRWFGRGALLIGLAIAWMAGWCLPSHAAVLRDVRIGEYETYTRIVFEFSEPAQMERIVDSLPDRLLVTFGKARVELKRKIPVGGSARIREIRLVDRQGTLSAQIHLTFDQWRFDAFPLDRPPRLVVDVFHTDAAPGAELSPTESLPAAPLPDAENPPFLPAAEKSDSVPGDDSGATPQPAAEKAPSVEVSAPPASFGDTPAFHASPSVEPTAPVLPSLADRPAPAPDTRSLTDYLYRPQEGQPQFYLWVALIVLSALVVALALLLRIARRSGDGASASAAGETAYQKEAEPIIDLIDRVASMPDGAEPIIELTERVPNPAGSTDPR